MQRYLSAQFLSAILLAGQLASACGAGTSGDQDSDGGVQDPDAQVPSRSDAGCYGSGQAGCQKVILRDLNTAIDILYADRTSYAGYSKTEAKDLARELYLNGVPQKAVVRVLTAQKLSGHRYRAFVTVTGEDGLPRSGLGEGDFSITPKGQAAIQAERVRELGDLTEQDVHAELSLVVDDSGSVQDCDARFVSQGLAYLFEKLPRIYAAELIKFDDRIITAAARTEDTEALADGALHVCTQRGATALWDAMDQGLAHLTKPADFRAQIVFTDGLDNSSQRKSSQVADHAAEADIPIFTVALGYADVFSLRRLYDTASGGLVYVPSGERILRGFEQITDFVRHSYMVEWSSEVDVDEIEVSATGHGDTATVHLP